MSYTYEYPRPAVAVDLVVFRMAEKGREVLLIKRKHEPFADCWAVPGGFMNEGETLEAAAARELMEETSLSCVSLRQLHTFSDVERDPRTRVISVAFLAEIKPNQMPTANDDAKEAQWFSIVDLPSLAFDHDRMIKIGLDVVRTPIR